MTIALGHFGFAFHCINRLVKSCSYVNRADFNAVLDNVVGLVKDHNPHYVMPIGAMQGITEQNKPKLGNIHIREVRQDSSSLNALITDEGVTALNDDLLNTQLNT